MQFLVFCAKQTTKTGAASAFGDEAAAMQVVVYGLKGSSLRTLQLMTGGGMGDRIVQTLLHLFNGRPGSALMTLFGC